MSDFEKYDDILDVEFTLPIDKEFISQVKHCPVVLIVDTSSSMADKIDELNAGVEALKTALMEDDTTHDSVDIAIIEMGMGMAQLSQPFTTVSSWNVKKYSVQKNMTWLHTSIETSWVEGIYISAVTTA